MNDPDIAKHISELTAEEHKLENAHIGEPLTGEELARMKELDVALDQAYDLLRQRRARRTEGQSDDSKERPASIVENYEQ